MATVQEPTLATTRCDTTRVGNVRPDETRRGLVGGVFEDVFQDLYTPERDADEQEESADADQREPEGDRTSVPSRQDDSPSRAEATLLPDEAEPEIASEDLEIAAVQAQLDEEVSRLEDAAAYISDRHVQAGELDRREADNLREHCGLVLGEHVPIRGSNLQSLLDQQVLEDERLLLPQTSMLNAERNIAVATGRLQQENLLQSSKPQEPNHLRTTVAMNSRMLATKLKPKMTCAQRTALADELEERARRKPKASQVMCMKDRAENMKILRRMETKVSFLKNPRYVREAEVCPFRITPSTVVFRNYEIGGVYELKVEIKNVTNVGRRVHATPCQNRAFWTSPVVYANGEDAMLAPGIAAHLVVHFSPDTLNNQTEDIWVCTEIGKFPLPVLARRVQPQLDFENPVDCGCVLSGQQSVRQLRLTNGGGEGSFRLVPASEEHWYETEKGETSFVTRNFKVTPTAFYLETKESINLTVRFTAAEVRTHHYPLRVECDNGEFTPMTLTALSDGIRLELLQPQPPTHRDASSPWFLVPWQLNWLQPGVQVGDQVAQKVVISNGGYLPVRVQWNLVQPEGPILSKLAVGSQQRLTDEMLLSVREWKRCESTDGSQSCPFTVAPISATLDPFTRAIFTFSFLAQTPGKRSTRFAYLEATDIPASRHSLLHFDRLLELQSSMQPETYVKGLPLFGPAVGQRCETPCTQSSACVPTESLTTCVVTAFCLQGMSVPPSVRCMPVGFGHVLPFITHTREVTLRNAGLASVRFRLRTTRLGDTSSSPLWVVDVEDVPQPESVVQLHGEMDASQLAAQRLASKWPPLPSSCALDKLATCLVEPHEGIIPQGETVTLRVSLRICRECDLETEITVDLQASPCLDELAAPPVVIRVRASARSPQVELRGASTLDYGVVRAHAKATRSLQIHNPNELPALVRLRQHGVIIEDNTFPFEGHQDLVDLFLARRTEEEFHAMTGAQEVAVKPWVHSRSGCVDHSGRARPANGCSNADFVFHPTMLVVWPHRSADVGVSLKTYTEEKLTALVEVVGFDSRRTRCLEVKADVQLPRLRLACQHAHFPRTYVKTPSQPVDLTLCNDSDLPAAFHVSIPSADLNVQINKMKGVVQPRDRLDLVLVVVPEHQSEHLELTCDVLVDDTLQPLALRVSAVVYGLEVDYAIVAPGAPPPDIKFEPRTDETGSTFPVSTGVAKRSFARLEFGEVTLGSTKEMQLVLYNRSGIGTPVSVRVERNPAHEGEQESVDSGTQTLRVHDYPRVPIQTFVNAPQPAACGRAPDTLAKPRGTMGRSRSLAPKTRDWKSKPLCAKRRSASTRRCILDDGHERRTFRSSVGEEYTEQKVLKSHGCVALKGGRGWAVKLESPSNWLEPFGTLVITCTCYCDLPGSMKDHVTLSLAGLPEHASGAVFRIPVRLVSHGNPLYLPEQQVGLSLHSDPPLLSCGTLVPSEKTTSRRFKVGNNSATNLHISWNIYPKSRLESLVDRQFTRIALCSTAKECRTSTADNLGEEHGAEEEEASDQEELPFKFQAWVNDPLETVDPFSLEGEPPLKIVPEEAVVPMQGTTLFTVTLTATKATATAGGHYHYKLVGKGRHTLPPDRRVSVATEPTEQSCVSLGVAALPWIQLDNEELHSDDSDKEQISTPNEVSREPSEVCVVSQQDAAPVGLLRQHCDEIDSWRPLEKKPNEDVVATIVLDCVSDCILPRLSVDKKPDDIIKEFSALLGDVVGDPFDGRPRNCPVFKFVHSATLGKKRSNGAMVGGSMNGKKVAGVVSYLVRQVTLVNENACIIPCRFRVEGPFRILELSQVGRKAVVHPDLMGRTAKWPSGERHEEQVSLSDPAHQLFTISKWETITLFIEFVPAMVPVGNWTEEPKQIFRGDLLVEYPRDAEDAEGRADFQRVHLLAVSCRPTLRLFIPAECSVQSESIDLVSNAEFVDFGFVHVESSITRKRTVLLLNDTNVVAKWRLLHVGQKRVGSAAEGSTEQEVDDKDTFSFDVCDGELDGPSKDCVAPNTAVRTPWWYPAPGAPRSAEHHDEKKYEPVKICITFKPKKNQVYRSRFRIEVEGGNGVDFTCCGRGSYEEEHDMIESQK